MQPCNSSHTMGSRYQGYGLVLYTTIICHPVRILGNNYHGMGTVARLHKSAVTGQESTERKSLDKIKTNDHNDCGTVWFVFDSRTRPRMLHPRLPPVINSAHYCAAPYSTPTSLVSNAYAIPEHQYNGL